MATGTLTLDPYFNQNIQGAHDAGLQIGVYFYTQAVTVEEAKAEADFNMAIRLSANNAFLYYDRGNMYAAIKDYGKATEDYSKALEIDPTLAEAYFNRGMAYILTGDKTKGIVDLGKAGELGLYEAYSIIKQHQKK